MILMCDVEITPYQYLKERVVETVIKKYIDCEAVLEQITEIKNEFAPTVRPMFDVFKHMLLEAPAADVEPVVHGKWTSFPNNNVWSIKCSECHRLLPFGTLPEEMEYCPHCGAHMSGGNK